MRKRHIIVGFSMVVVGLILFITPVSPPHREWEPINVDMAPIYKGLVGIPLILVGINVCTFPAFVIGSLRGILRQNGVFHKTDRMTIEQL